MKEWKRLEENKNKTKQKKNKKTKKKKTHKKYLFLCIIYEIFFFTRKELQK